MPVRTVTSIVSKMIWNEELSASLDQSGDVLVFHRIELSRTQQLAQTVAEKVAAMVDQSEKALDTKMGGAGGWVERTDGPKGDKRGEQAQERRGRGERTRGARGLWIPPTSITVRTITYSSLNKVARVAVAAADSHKGWAIKCQARHHREKDELHVDFFAVPSRFSGI